MQLNRVEGNQGINWFKCGWALFKRDFGTWLIMFVVFAGISIVLNLIPFIGWLAAILVSPVLLAGFMHSAAKLEQQDRIEIADLFQGFRDKQEMNQLLVLGGLVLAAQIIASMLIVSLVGSSIITGAAYTGDFNIQSVLTGGTLVGILLIFLLGLIVTMGFFFATPLIMLDKLAAVDSIKASFSACTANIVPLLVFGVIYLLLAIIAAIPMGLGFLILLPLTILALYCSYRNIFH